MRVRKMFLLLSIASGSRGQEYKSRCKSRLSCQMNRMGRIKLNKFLDVNRLRSLWSTFHVETYAISLTQRAKSLRRNGTVVDENVSLVLRFNETIAFFVVEPFHAAFRHFSNSFHSPVLFPLLAISLLRAILAKPRRMPIRPLHFPQRPNQTPLNDKINSYSLKRKMSSV